MIKKVSLFVLTILLFLTSIGQSISPSETIEFCPNQNITFTVTLPRITDGTVPSVSSWTNSPIVVSGINPTSIVNTPTQTTCTFVGKFRDVNINQVFRITYTTAANPTGTTYDPQFKKVKSLFYDFTTSSSCLPIQLNQSNVLVPRCEIVDIPVSFNNIKWKHLWRSYCILLRNYYNL